MTHLRLCLLALFSVTAAACASAPDALPATVGDAGAPAPIADHDWFSYADEDAARLTYGRDESDDVWVSLDCSLGSGVIAIDQYLSATDEPRITLESGGETETWPARVAPDEMTDGTLLNARAASTNPVFLRFRRTGWLAAWGAEGRVMMAAHTGSDGGIERFFAACG